MKGTKEIKCTKCGKFFHTDNVTLFCPRCVDPNSIPGCTFLKETVLNLLRREMQMKGVETSYFSRDDLVGMLQQYPRASEVFHSNAEYRTITIYPGDKFPGGNREFIIGNMVRKNRGRLITYRDVTCTNCDKAILYPSNRVLRWFLGFEKKWCRSCDYKEYSDWKRNISGLKKGGTVNPNSLRSMAKAMNVSRSQMRTNPPSQRVPHLPVGTQKASLVIVEAFWCERVEAPKYRLICEKCKRYFVISQRDWENCEHLCY